MSSLRILLAEDNPGDVWLVQESLQEHRIEHTLYIVSDGERALHFVKNMGTAEAPFPDVFLLDLNLPMADGPTILRQFRQHPECKLTPVIIMTSSDRPQDKAEVTALGISHYFHKPSDLAGFLRFGAVVRAVIEGHAPGKRKGL